MKTTIIATIKKVHYCNHQGLSMFDAIDDKRNLIRCTGTLNGYTLEHWNTELTKPKNTLVMHGDIDCTDDMLTFKFYNCSLIIDANNKIHIPIINKALDFHHENLAADRFAPAGHSCPARCKHLNIRRPKMTKGALVPYGDKTVLRICGEKWPRLMSVRVAAAYTSQTSPENFKKIPEFAALIKERFGRESVDRHELDQVLNCFMEEEVHA